MRLLTTVLALTVACGLQATTEFFVGKANAQFGGGGGGQADCQSLWVERNTFYKLAGYCFKTRRAIEFFGNDGCTVQNEAQIQFPPEVRRRIQEITRAERAMNCPR